MSRLWYEFGLSYQEVCRPPSPGYLAKKGTLCFVLWWLTRGNARDRQKDAVPSPDGPHDATHHIAST